MSASASPVAIATPHFVQFVPMRSDDLDAVAALEALIYPYPWTRGNFADSLAAGYSAWLMLADGALAGYALMTLVLDEAQLLNISVVQQKQRAGLGSRLLQHLFVVARSHGATRIYLEVRRSNVAALEFYHRHEFAAIGERRAYYPADRGREDAIVLARNLNVAQAAAGGRT